jgi:PIN domain nuclease of toxin-antitoxin system
LPIFDRGAGCHGDPVDRMLIAHALHAGLTLVTADETIRRYPVPTIW